MTMSTTTGASLADILMTASPAVTTTMMVTSMTVTTSTPLQRMSLEAGDITTSVLKLLMKETTGLPVLLCRENLTGIWLSGTVGYLIANVVDIARYYGSQKRTNFMGSQSSGGATDFRYYNYRRVPYLGGSDHFDYLNKTVLEAQLTRSIE